MTQRNPMNERYKDENRGGKTRKSSASAKPKAARASMVRDPAPKSKKQKKEEARERERKAMQKADSIPRFEDTPGYKKLRRFWWIALVGAIACTALSFLIQSNGGEALQGVSMGIMVLAYVLIIVAFWIDLGKIRKERKAHEASYTKGKSKEARKEQKKLRAELRAQEKEAEEKFQAAKAEEEAKKDQGLFSRFKKKGSDKPEETDKASTGNDGEAAKEATSE